jgi:hypothetical protein
MIGGVLLRPQKPTVAGEAVGGSDRDREYGEVMPARPPAKASLQAGNRPRRHSAQSALLDRLAEGQRSRDAAMRSVR